MPLRSAPEPTSTYRLQLRQGITLPDARRAVPSLSSLGISHLYLSPPWAAVDGSTHGYDVIDPNRIDPTLGTEGDLRELASTLHDSRMGLLVDLVPNHMAASPQNAWWRDLLARGRRSPSARIFDVDLEALDGKVMLPILAAPLEHELEAGAFEVDVAAGELRYGDLAMPLAPGSMRDGDDLRAVLDRQHYVLEHWRDASGRRNYRRFFDVTDLVGVRQEDPRVFRMTHRLVRALVRDGVVDGVRVDHVDGLRDPLGYLEALRSSVRPPWLLVEKILAGDEQLPGSWPVDGTTGYEATNDLNDLFVVPRGWERLGRLAATFRGGASPSFEEIRAVSRRLVLETSFRGEVDALTRRLARLAAMATPARQPSSEQLRAALVEATAEMDVYRTYVRDASIAPEDRRRIRGAVSRAAANLGTSHRGAISLLRRTLLLDVADDARALALEIVGMWQQLTGPVAAKGEEDTASYRDVSLLSRNEVGSDPGRAPRAAHEVRHRFAARGRRWPRTMTATSTHDTKRGEDTRARIDVLSELADEWRRAVERWSVMNASSRRTVGDRDAPSPAEELMLYQTLVGIWPVAGQRATGLNDRIRAFLEKALREAKVNSSWLDPDEAYEGAVFAFATAILGRRNAAFVDELSHLAERVAFHGALNSLSQVIVKSVLPGVPDLYQGNETWNLTLVDPDNRRPPALDRSARALATLDHLGDGLDDPATLLERWPTGDVKRFVTVRMLRFRRDHPELFAEGARSVEVEVAGRRARNVLATARRRRDTWAVAVTPRFTTGLAGTGEWPLGRAAWGETMVRLGGSGPGSFREVITGTSVDSRDGAIAVAETLQAFPVAVLTSA